MIIPLPDTLKLTIDNNFNYTKRWEHEESVNEIDFISMIFNILSCDDVNKTFCSIIDNKYFTEIPDITNNLPDDNINQVNVTFVYECKKYEEPSKTIFCYNYCKKNLNKKIFLDAINGKFC